VTARLSFLAATLGTLGTKLDQVLAKVVPVATKTLATPPVYRLAGHGVACNVLNPTAAPVSVTVTFMNSNVVHSGPVPFELAAGQATGFVSFAFDGGNPCLSAGLYWCKFESAADISGVRGSVGLHAESGNGVNLSMLPAQ
jgi:hypothetical protein